MGGFGSPPYCFVRAVCFLRGDVPDAPQRCSHYPLASHKQRISFHLGRGRCLRRPEKTLIYNGLSRAPAPTAFLISSVRSRFVLFSPFGFCGRPMVAPTAFRGISFVGATIGRPLRCSHDLSASHKQTVTHKHCRGNLGSPKERRKGRAIFVFLSGKIGFF